MFLSWYIRIEGIPLITRFKTGHTNRQKALAKIVLKVFHL